MCLGESSTLRDLPGQTCWTEHLDLDSALPRSLPAFSQCCCQPAMDNTEPWPCNPCNCRDLSWQASSSDVTVTTATLARWHWTAGIIQTPSHGPTISQRRGPDTKITDLHVLNKPQKKKGSTTQHQDAPSDKWWPQCIAALIHWLCMASTGEEKIWHSRSYFPTFYSSSSPLLLGDPAILYTVEKKPIAWRGQWSCRIFLDIYWTYDINWYCIIVYYIYICVCDIIIMCVFLRDILYNVLYILALFSPNPHKSPILQSSNPSLCGFALHGASLAASSGSIRARPAANICASSKASDGFRWIFGGSFFVLFMFCLCSVSIIPFHLFHSLIIWYIIFIRYHLVSWLFMLRLLQFLPYTRPVDASTAGCPGLLCGTKKVRQVLVANW